MLRVIALAAVLCSCHPNEKVKTPGNNTYGTSGGVTPGAPQPSKSTGPGDTSASSSGKTGAAGVTSGSASGSAAETKQHTH
jgi:hypothetical protein